MAKGLRSKVKRRIRAARREHFMNVQGNKSLEEFNKRLTDPNSNINVTSGIKPNGFLEPNNPEATIPKRIKENNIDFRSSAIPGFGRTSRFTSRNNIPGSTRKVSKYASIVKTTEDLEKEEIENQEKEERKEAQRHKDDLEESNKLLSGITLEEKMKQSYADMDTDDKRMLMTAKSGDSVEIKKRKRGSRGKIGNKRTLVY